jgi:sulfur carrier protein ThiS adenylyltransferase
VFACVDTIDARKLIWDSVKDNVSFFGDGRMTAEVIRILTACDTDSRQHYPSTLFTQAEAHAGACTSRMTVFAANVAAGMLIAQFSRWLRGLPTSRDLTLNLLADELNIL